MNLNLRPPIVGASLAPTDRDSLVSFQAVISVCRLFVRLAISFLALAIIPLAVLRFESDFHFPKMAEP